ncbi:MAG TPA: NAD(P)/FAD-dependent oxidoreductase [Chloroflexota bacterium]|nr:NAD(P)/FAD-dependent oxidoreductase [Chloroflexota bacterium]
MKAANAERIVILGGGFGGVAVARGLAKRLPKDTDASVTLVDQNNFFLFTPMLTEAAAGEIDTRHIVNPLRKLLRRARFEQGRVDGVARDGGTWRITLTRDGPAGGKERSTLEAEHVVLALGSTPSFHHLEGVEEYALTMKSLGDAIALRNRVSALLEEVDGGSGSPGGLSFVIAGGGFSGVETMAALNDYVRSSLPLYPRVREADVHMYLVEEKNRLLPEISEGLARYAGRKLAKRGVEILLNTGVTEVSKDTVRLSTGRELAARTFIWTASLAPSPVIGTIDVPRSKRGAIVVDAHCAAPGQPGLWALGDCAEVPREGDGKTGAYGQTAQNATREGTLVAENIMAVMRGEEPRAFNYQPIGELAIVGRRRGVAQIKGMKFSGVPAWMLWRSIYLAKLPRASKRARVGIDWGLDLLFGRDVSTIPTKTGNGPS